jgi:hypothetical protein
MLPEKRACPIVFFPSPPAHTFRHTLCNPNHSEVKGNWVQYRHTTLACPARRGCGVVARSPRPWRWLPGVPPRHCRRRSGGRAASESAKVECRLLRFATTVSRSTRATSGRGCAHHHDRGSAGETASVARQRTHKALGSGLRARGRRFHVGEWGGGPATGLKRCGQPAAVRLLGEFGYLLKPKLRASALAGDPPLRPGAWQLAAQGGPCPRKRGALFSGVPGERIRPVPPRAGPSAPPARALAAARASPPAGSRRTLSRCCPRSSNSIRSIQKERQQEQDQGCSLGWARRLRPRPSRGAPQPTPRCGLCTFGSSRPRCGPC